MIGDNFEFVWRVHSGGYEVRDAMARMRGEKTPRRYLTYQAPLKALSTYKPLEEKTGLFRAFAEVKPDEANIVAFANRYGMLSAADLVGPATASGEVVAGEPIDTWVEEISAMRRALDIWDMVGNEDRRALADHVYWNGSAAVGYRFADKGGQAEGWIATDQIHPDALAKFIPGDVIKPALHYVQAAVNARLDGGASPRMLWSAEHLGLYIVPANLVGALWLQLAQALHSGNTFRRCAECGEWYEIVPPVSRQTRQFCGSACKMRSHRRRKAASLDMGERAGAA